jgi:hypothetical protein
MDEHPITGSESDVLRGSAWAAVDETFFRIVQDSFSHVFCLGASALLASNDEDTPEPPAVIHLPQDDREVEIAASMHRHPSARRRF